MFFIHMDVFTRKFVLLAKAGKSMQYLVKGQIHDYFCENTVA